MKVGAPVLIRTRLWCPSRQKLVCTGLWARDSLSAAARARAACDLSAGNQSKGERSYFTSRVLAGTYS